MMLPISIKFFLLVTIVLVSSFISCKALFLFGLPNLAKVGTCPYSIATFPCITCTADTNCPGNQLCCPVRNNLSNLCCTPAVRL
ncbi:hypothetical protein CHUAL_002013 [Chamberlinius hualienensis]